ncbi:MAG TPA: hypothetical protein VK308_01675 [Pyrinomonadaceae bacterium]|nr:hypothetical protein [Pyrinomonadaceae bacterium]
MEKRLEEHRAAIEVSLQQESDKISVLVSSLSRQINEEFKAGNQKIFNAYRKIETDLSAVNNLAGSLNKSVSEASKTYSDSTNAVNQISTLFERFKDESKEAAENIQKVRQDLMGNLGETSERIENRFEESRKHIKRSIFFVSGIVAICLLCFTIMTAGSISVFMNLDAEKRISKMDARFEEEKNEIRVILRKAIEEAQENQMADEAKVDLWDAMMQSLNPQQRNAYIIDFNKRMQELKTARNKRKPELAEKTSSVR